MSDFLEEVFVAQANQPSPRRRRRKPHPGFSGRRYAVLLTVMASLTAVPTWIMLRAGASGIDGPTAASVQPLLLPHIDLGVPASAAPWALSSPMPVHGQPQPPAQQEPPQVAPPLLLEGRSYVDTGTRPVRKPKPARPKEPAQQPPAQDTPATATPEPTMPASPPPSTPGSGARAEPQRAAEWPPVERPEVERPRVQRPEPPQPPQLNDLRARS